MKIIILISNQTKPPNSKDFKSNSSLFYSLLLYKSQEAKPLQTNSLWLDLINADPKNGEIFQLFRIY